MFEVNVSLFYEGESREYDEFYVMGTFRTHRAAERFAHALATKCSYEIMQMLDCDPNGDDGYDGLSIDVRRVSDPPGCFDVSYELMPGRRMIAWHANECHERSGQPKEDGTPVGRER